ncbi:Phox homologous domain-containing protein [Pilobolus umbonatus]|nr:Phox homologous domain-containing protein [Pilobolus umbonatus]
MNSDMIKSIFFKQTMTKHDPKPYTAYRIDITTPFRTWHLWKRYSDFIQLNERLIHSFPGIALPAQLPQKNIFPPTFSVPDKVEERRQRLEDYVRTIQGSRDDRWRKTDIWVEFFSLPSEQMMCGEDRLFSFSSWLNEYDDLMSLCRSIRSLLSNRAVLHSQHEISEAMQCEIKAKKELLDLSKRLIQLENGLCHQKLSLSEGEGRRREDKLNELKEEKETVSMMVSVARRTKNTDIVKRRVIKTNHLIQSSAIKGTSEEDIGFDTVTFNPSKGHTLNKGRTFGVIVPYKESVDSSKGMENDQILLYQNQLIDNQDREIEKFSQLLAKQKELGLAIHEELGFQIDLVNSLDLQADDIQSKLQINNRKIRKLV